MPLMPDTASPVVTLSVCILYNDPMCFHVVISVDVLSEEIIVHWYKEGHSNKGKSVFLDQMKPFIEWLKNAEEEGR